MKRLTLAVALLAACLAVPITAADASPPDPSIAAAAVGHPLAIVQAVIPENAVQPVDTARPYVADAGDGNALEEAEDGVFGGIGELLAAIAALVIGWFGKKFKDRNSDKYVASNRSS